MQIIKSISQWQTIRKQLTQSLGFVATMGNLHRGHLSLVKQAQKDNALSIVSIYVNPTQFNNPDDFNTYPNTLEQDIALLEQAQVDYCLIPDYEQLYADDYRFQIHENQLSTLMEGKYRPGHFNGMLTVVMKLLNIIKPSKAYFGEKDYQQYLLIKQMAASFFLNSDIIACPTIRENSNLAYSSRNNRLSAQQKKKAEQFAQLFHQGSNCEEIKINLKKAGINIDYIEDYKNRRFAAVNIGEIRLIDNYELHGV